MTPPGPPDGSDIGCVRNVAFPSCRQIDHNVRVEPNPTDNDEQACTRTGEIDPSHDAVGEDPCQLFWAGPKAKGLGGEVFGSQGEDSERQGPSHQRRRHFTNGSVAAADDDGAMVVGDPATDFGGVAGAGGLVTMDPKGLSIQGVQGQLQGGPLSGST